MHISKSIHWSTLALQNFNACAAVAPPVVVGEKTGCIKPTAKATLTSDWWLSFPLTLVDASGKLRSRTAKSSRPPKARSRSPCDCDVVTVYQGEVKCKSGAALNLVSLAVLCLALLFSL